MNLMLDSREKSEFDGWWISVVYSCEPRCFRGLFDTSDKRAVLLTVTVGFRGKETARGA